MNSWYDSCFLLLAKSRLEIVLIAVETKYSGGESYVALWVGLIGLFF